MGERVAPGCSATCGSSRPKALMAPDELRRRASVASLGAASGPRWQRRVPVIAKTALKDARVAARPAFRVDRSGPVARSRHRLRVAAARAVPLGRSASGTRARRAFGGVRARAARVAGARSGAFAARDGASGSSAPVSARRCGPPTSWRADRKRSPSRCGASVSMPTGSSSRRPAPTSICSVSQPDREAARRRLGLDDRFVVGWVGSFRRFHALEQAVDAVARPRGHHAAARRRRSRARGGRALGARTRRCGDLHRHRPARRRSRASRGDGRRARARERRTGVPLLAAEARRVPRRRAPRGRAPRGRPSGSAPRRCRRCSCRPAIPTSSRRAPAAPRRSRGS